MSWLSRLRNRWRERELGQEFTAELDFHLASRIEANRRRGLSAAEAEREARRHLGNLTRVREGMREVRMLAWFEEMVHDVRYGARVFKRQPALTALAILTLSLGIGANAAIFSVFEAAWLRPLPFPDGDRLVRLVDGVPGARGSSTPTIPETLEVRDASRALEAVSFYDTRDFQVTGGDEPERVIGARVDPAFLSMLGARPVLGRIFGAGDVNGDAAIAVLSDGFFKRNFGANADVVGRTLEVNGTAHRIVGVLPAEFSLGSFLAASIDVFVPYPTSAEYTSRSGEFANVRRVNALGRVARTSSVEAATAELRTIAAAMAVRHPDVYRAPDGAGPAFVMGVEPLRESLTRGSRPILLMLLGAVVLLLLIACVNTAQFLLAQSIEREPEMALRIALGAGRLRLVRQIASETLLLTGLGGLIGIGQAIWLTRLLQSLVPESAPIVGRVGLDGTVLVFMLAVTLLTAMGCVVVPSLRLSGDRVRPILEARGTWASRAQARQWFIAAEVAMSVVLLVGAGLLLRSLYELQQTQSGFSPDRVSVLRIRGIGAGTGLVENYRRYLQGIAAVPGVEAVGLASAVMPGRAANRFTIVGESPDASAQARQQTGYQMVSTGYFAALGISLEAGRLFTDEDTGRGPPVAIVNREMADRFWPGASPLDRQIRAGEGPRNSTMTVVGVVGNVRPIFSTGDEPQLYVSYLQQPEPNMALVVRTKRGVPLPLPPIKTAIWSVDSRQAVFGVAPLTELVAQATSRQRAVATLIGAFACLALAMSASGIYTVVTYVASRRVKEIAIRRAIGASTRDVLWTLVGPTLRWTVAGLALGIAGAITASGALRAALSGILPLDLTLIGLVSGLYLGVVAVALATAARGALRIDPVTALRME